MKPKAAEQIVKAISYNHNKVSWGKSRAMKTKFCQVKTGKIQEYICMALNKNYLGILTLILTFEVVGKVLIFSPKLLLLNMLDYSEISESKVIMCVVTSFALFLSHFKFILFSAIQKQEVSSCKELALL